MAAVLAGLAGSAVLGGLAVLGGCTGHAQRALGLTSRARLVHLRHSSCLSVQVWQAPIVGGRATIIGTTNEVDRATHPILEDTIQVLS